MQQKFDGPAIVAWREHWTVVLSSVFGIGLLTVYQHSTGIMTQPLEREFGWTRAQISLGPTIVAVVGCFLAPFIGMAIDKSAQDVLQSQV